MGKPLGKLGRFSQGPDPGPAQGLTWASPGLGPGQSRSIFGQDFGQTEQKQKWGRKRRSGKLTLFSTFFFGPAFVSVLFDQNLDQKMTWLAWAGLGQTLGWPRSSPGLGQGQALGWARVKPWAGPWSSPGKTGPENLAISQPCKNNPM